MIQNTDQKLDRVRRIHAEIERLLAAHGTPLPSHYPGSPKNAAIFEKPPLVISMSPDRFRTFAAKSRYMVGETLMERKGWFHVDLKLYGQRRLSYNLSADGKLVIYHFQPGYWMLDFFGVDPEGDHSPIIASLYPEDQDPSWKAFKRSGLSKWPPYFDEE